MKHLLIYNPQAGHRRAEKMLPDVEACLTDNGIEFDLQLTDYPEHATEITSRIDLKPYAGVIAAGGDGTLFEVVNGLFRNKARKKPTLGILPIGTGNAAARDLDLDAENWQKAVAIIAAGRTRGVDIGRFISHSQTYWFINILGLGFVADVTKTAKNLKIFGNVSYTLGVLWQALRLPLHDLTIVIDGREYKRRNLFVEVSNTRYTSNFLMAPAAEIDDGLLDVTLANKMGRVRLLKLFPKVFTGEHVGEAEVEQFTAKKISIVTDPPKVLTPDGELIGITPIEIECLHRALNVYWT
ncbi:diacylglycerol kinase family lipid kinase [bacterium]|nr:diacylglycerol kinase family lipid kinase [bacterium]